MNHSLQPFLTGLIDYAGMFPPASLDRQTAMERYAGYLSGNDGWMLGRCVISALQLHAVSLQPGFRFSVIVSQALEKDELTHLRSFKGCVEMVETRMVSDDDSPARLQEKVLQLRTILTENGLAKATLFIEPGNFAAAAETVGNGIISSTPKSDDSAIGLKLRCGGTTRQAFPPAGKIAEAIISCHSYNIPLKFTAGLHHPLTNYCSQKEFRQYGFINVFGGALLYFSGKLEENELIPCLCDPVAGNFHFGRKHFSWKEHAIAADEIKRLRQSRLISFGSCSFTEPVERLKTLAQDVFPAYTANGRRT